MSITWRRRGRGRASGWPRSETRGATDGLDGGIAGYGDNGGGYYAIGPRTFHSLALPMKSLKTPILPALLLALCAPAQAEDIRPGLWKITLESRVAATPGWQPQPFELTQCLSQDDADHPERLLTGSGGPGVSGCDFGNRTYSAGHLSFDVACAGDLGLKGHGELDFSATRIDGALDVNFGENEKTDMGNQFHAVYLGECTGGNAPATAPLPAAPPAN